MKPLVEEFAKDRPKERDAAAEGEENLIPDAIAGCSAIRLVGNEDDRGFLIELLTTRDRLIEPIVHVYQVYARPRSLRAWIYHKEQSDRLCFTNGHFKLVLCDIREDSPTYRRVNELVVGDDNRVLVTIPPLVVHGVQNLGTATSSFVNMPTRPYHHADPDKYRLPADAPLLGYSFAR